MLVQVVDFSDEHYREQMQVTAETLKELEAGGIPQIIVYNKADKCKMENIPKTDGNHIYMAAGENIGIEELAELILKQVYAGCSEVTFLIPYDKGAVSSYLMEHTQIKEIKYCEEGIELRAVCRKQDASRYEMYQKDRN